MAGGCLETGGAFVEVTVDVDVAKFPALEAGLMVTRVVASKRCVVVTASPPNCSTSGCSFFFFGQRQ